MGRVRVAVLKDLAWPAAAALAYFALAYAAMHLTVSTQGLATVWPASGILTAALLLSARRRQGAMLLLVGLASVLGNLLGGVPLAQAMGFTLANLVEASVICWLTVRGGRCGNFAQLRVVLRFALAALAGSAVGAGLASTITGNWNVVFAFSWFVTVLLGNLIVAPLIVLIAQSGQSEDGAGGWRQLAETMGILGLVLAACLAVAAQQRYPLLFLPVTACLFATYRLGPFGAAASVGINALIGSLAIAWGVGPLHLVSGDRVELIHFFQFYLLVLLLSALPLAALLAQRDAMLAGLTKANRMLEMAERHARVGHWRVTLRDSSVFWSDEMYRIHGVERGFQPDLAFVRSAIHPDDQEQVDTTISRSIRSGRPYSLSMRIFRADGELRHIDCHGEPERGREGGPVAVFGTFIDVTDRARVLEELDKARRQAQREARQATALAETDQLTGIPNRRRILALLSRAIAEAGRRDEPLSVAVLDIDHFKAINDQFGHLVGDEVLARVARICRVNMRSRDHIGRLGGEEFLIILPQADAATAHEIAERIRCAIGLSAWHEVPGLAVTGSFGVATLADGADEMWLLQAADDAMYKAKRSGRNCLRSAA